MRFAVLTFPGTWSDWDCVYALRGLHEQKAGQDLGRQEAERVSHRNSSLEDFDAVIIPGGFSYGDHLRCGAIARFAPIMSALERFIETGRPVLGSCNGFQILCEAGMLPGALLPNASSKFRCEPDQRIHVATTDSGFTSACKDRRILKLPISHGAGNYQADSDTLQRLKDQNRILFRYSSTPGRELSDVPNPNGSADHIAGILNESGNVLGMMPHPERASDPLLDPKDGRCDGIYIWRSIIEGWA